MLSKTLKIGLLVLLVAAGAGAIVALRLDGARWRQRIIDARRRNDRTQRLREENRRTHDLLARVEADERDGTQAIHGDVIRKRAEVFELESRAEEKRTLKLVQSAADADVLANNRDPRRGFVRLENLQNAGQATPGAALQTLVWAALKGDDEMLARLSLISAPARARAEALIAGLPADAGERWTPEKFSALFFTGAFTELSAIQFASETMDDSERATIAMRAPGLPNEQKLKFQLGAVGWQVVVDEKLIVAVQRKMASPSTLPAKK